MTLEMPLLRNKSSRLLPCHQGIFGVNVELVEVCSSSVGLPDRVPAIFFNLGGQAWDASPADVPVGVRLALVVALGFHTRVFAVQ
jgi:hypothetical protein